MTTYTSAYVDYKNNLEQVSKVFEEIKEDHAKETLKDEDAIRESSDALSYKSETGSMRVDEKDENEENIEHASPVKENADSEVKSQF